MALKILQSFTIRIKITYRFTYKYLTSLIISSGQNPRNDQELDQGAWIFLILYRKAVPESTPNVPWCHLYSNLLILNICKFTNFITQI